MFGIGDTIVYGFEGVFTVSEYTSSPIDKNDKRVFYILTPIFGSSGNIIVAPSEGGATSMRPVISKEEAMDFVELIPSILPVVVEKERNRRDVYKAVMNNGSCSDYVSIIKTVRCRREEVMAQKRRISETDADFEGMAKRCLYSELSVAMDLPYVEIESLIMEKLNK